MLRTAVAIVSMMGLSGSVLAVEGELAREPGSVLLGRCEAAAQVLQGGIDLDPALIALAGTCVAFLDGFIFGHGWASWREQGDMYYCPPPDFSASAAVPVVVEYLRAHPDRADARAHVLVFAALSAAFPCTPAGAPKQ